ncbi:SMP-30/gluconolactonase/LRE family protein [Hoeflea prorocentri]|uniref:SMP-30/gluconolactonase/LRE family protein n=1 Tax=Hoeflea prorocentri TaxID=1922333 RepID=A0A9X3ZIG7_9HYPH|nr:SMP-30/gluconolactonase/LRE family protein [Hoeflea prorocentri]MCY6381826.1 SMP-30/gluconolactonase/LRE family protein [Hoeflea prorocentri]MDA5399626.1 SMP-30/gluconolactonase/LRE family protein [Hoeflea prorocentri]
MKPEVLGPERDEVGESPFWDGAGHIWSVDIVGKRIRRRRFSDGQTETWQTDDLPTALALSPEGPAAVSFAGGVARWSPGEGPTATTIVPERDPYMRLNEGKCDPAGRLWVASMENNLTPDLEPREQAAARGRLYRLDGTNVTGFGEADLGIPNTMAWSPDRTRFYFGDSLQNTIWVWDYDNDSGDIYNRRVFVSGGPGLPDGSTMDADGCLWTARFSAGRVIRYAPDGRVDRVIDLPVENPTAATFAGDDLSTLIVTSARFAMDDPSAIDGATLKIATDVTGQPENWFGG